MISAKPSSVGFDVAWDESEGEVAYDSVGMQTWPLRTLIGLRGIHKECSMKWKLSLVLAVVFFAWLAISVWNQAEAAEQAVAYDYPTNRTDGTELDDLVACQINVYTARFAPVYTQKVKRIGTHYVTNRVVASWSWQAGTFLRSQYEPVWTNAPRPGDSDSCTVTNLPNKTTVLKAEAIDSWAVKSDESAGLAVPAGGKAGIVNMKCLVGP